MSGKKDLSDIDELLADVDASLDSSDEKKPHPGEELGMQMEAVARRDSQDFDPSEFDDDTISFALPPGVVDDPMENGAPAPDNEEVQPPEDGLSGLPEDNSVEFEVNEPAALATKRLTPDDVGDVIDAITSESKIEPYVVHEPAAKDRRPTLAQKVYETVRQISFLKSLGISKSEEEELLDRQKKLEKQFEKDVSEVAGQYKWTLARIHKILRHSTRFSPSYDKTDMPEFMEGRRLEFILTYYRPIPERDYKSFKITCRLYDDEIESDIHIFDDKDGQEVDVRVFQQLYEIEVRPWFQGEKKEVNTGRSRGFTLRSIMPGNNAQPNGSDMEDYMSRLSIKILSYEYNMNRQPIREFMSTIAQRDDIEQEDKSLLGHALRQLFAIRRQILDELIEEIRKKQMYARKEVEKLLKDDKKYLEAMAERFDLDVNPSS